MFGSKFNSLCSGTTQKALRKSVGVVAFLLIAVTGAAARAATFPGPYTHNTGITILPQLTASTLTINSGQLVIDAKSQVRDPAGTSVISALNIRNLNDNAFSPAGAFDITNNALIIDYENSFPTDSIRRWIQSGFNSGKGIISTTTNQQTRLAYADNAIANFSTFGQVPVDSTSVLLTLAYAGDANLDNVVNLKDLYSLASHWQDAAEWTGGDFNYDGIVDATDLSLLALNWQAGIVNAPIDPGIDDLFNAVVTSLTSVPEPSSLGGLCVLARGLLRIRSRR